MNETHRGFATGVAVDAARWPMSQPLAQQRGRIGVRPGVLADDIERIEHRQHRRAGIRFGSTQRTGHELDGFEPVAGLLAAMGDFTDPDDDGRAVVESGHASVFRFVKAPSSASPA